MSFPLLTIITKASCNSQQEKLRINRTCKYMISKLKRTKYIKKIIIINMNLKFDVILFFVVVSMAIFLSYYNKIGICGYTI